MAVRGRGVIAPTAGALALALASVLVSQPAARAATYGSSAIVQRNGYPVFTVDGKPFFVYGGAFFYERMPPSIWEDSLGWYRVLGINTLDLYVPWNWHELSDGDFDFTGRTSPRRDLQRVMNLARKVGFKIILRPGPVIRNEWRNGGYPAWLLERPEYGMPLHDLLEGRYPPTATLQNAHSDDAAAEWMRNATHMRYAKRWLERVLHEFEPVADLVIAVQLDDDQGAYIDNQTWPAPHLRTYLEWLRDVVHGVTGPAVPVFINTYEMKVTASSPVWAWGNWYQSDAYSIGEHDRAQLEFDTGLLQTQPHVPVMLSEFQAGWLLQPGDVFPRAADPSNTMLAMSTLLGMGVHGIVNFPVQDTLNPDGMEAPFANWFYDWDAALRFTPRLNSFVAHRGGRSDAVEALGGYVRTMGPLLARAHSVADAAIAYMTTAFPEDAMSNDLVGTIATQTLAAQKRCRDLELTCVLVDLRFASVEDLRRYQAIILPVPESGARLPLLVPSVAAKLAHYVDVRHSLVVFGRTKLSGLPRTKRALRAVIARRHLTGLGDARLLATDDAGGAAFVVLPNYGANPTVYDRGTVRLPGGRVISLPRITVEPRSMRLIALSIPLSQLDRRLSRRDRIDFMDCAPLQGYHEGRDALQMAFSLRFAPCRLDLFYAGKRRTLSFNKDLAGEQFSNVEFPPRGDVVVAHVDADDGFGQCERAKQALPLRRDVVYCSSGLSATAADTAVAYALDLFASGQREIVMENNAVRVAISPEAGARAFLFEDLAKTTSVFTTVGALRDDVSIQPPPSPTDRIAKYTHQFPTGTFNRSYHTDILQSGPHAVVRFTYDAPDVVPAGAKFERTVTLEPRARVFTVDERVTFDGNDPAATQQRAVSLTSLAVGGEDDMSARVTLTPDARPVAPNQTQRVAAGNALGFYDGKTGELATVAWRPQDVEAAEVQQRADSVVARLALAPNRVDRSVYGYDFAPSVEAARARLDVIARAVSQGQAVPPANERQ